MEKPEETSQTFEDKRTLRKHLTVYMPGDLKEHGVLVEGNGVTFFFDDVNRLNSYLEIEEE